MSDYHISLRDSFISCVFALWVGKPQCAPNGLTTKETDGESLDPVKVV